MAKTMNINLVQEMVTNYKAKQYQSIINSTTNPMPFDAQSVWFELKALKTFIATIEAEVASHPTYDMGNLGVRFYYSAYPKNALWDDLGYEDIAGLNPAYEKLHTLIAIPTAEIDTVNSDFDPLDVKTYTGTKPTGAGLAIMAENHGNLNPPGPSSGLWF